MPLWIRRTGGQPNSGRGARRSLANTASTLERVKSFALFLDHPGVCSTWGRARVGRRSPSAEKAIRSPPLRRIRTWQRGSATMPVRHALLPTWSRVAWPDVADEVDIHDVVMCANVVYDVQDIGPFLDALAGHAGKGVVVEIDS